ncbi:MAG: hypothetical protein DSZ23_04690, partial [Thermodesulfatator sp.]
MEMTRKNRHLLDTKPSATTSLGLLVIEKGHVVAASDSFFSNYSLPVPVKKLSSLFGNIPDKIIDDLETGSVSCTYPFVWHTSCEADDLPWLFCRNVLLPSPVKDNWQFLLICHEAVSETLMTYLPVATIYSDSSAPLSIKHVSPAIEKWTGLPPEKLTGEESLFRLIIHPEDRSRVIDALNSVTPETSKFSIAYRLTHTSGKITWIKQELVPDASAANGAHHLFLLTDITAVKERQLALSQAEERYRLFFQRGPLAIMCIDRHGFVIDCNDRLAHLSGMEKKEVLGLNTLASTHPAIRDFAREVLRGRDMRYQGEYTIPGTESTIMVSVSAFPLRNEEGAVVGGYAFIEDITNRAELQRRLDEERDFNRLTIESAGILVAEVLSNGKILRTNNIVQEMLGLGAGELQKHLFWDILGDPSRKEALKEAFSKCMTTGHSTTIETPVTIDGRKKRQISWKINTCPASLKKGKNHDSDHLIVVGTDISSQRRLEEQIREIQKMDAIGRLAGGVAHDFNNQLTAILGYCQMLLMDTEPSSRTFKQLQIIEKAAKRASETTNQLLAFSRKQTLQPKKVLLNKAVKDASGLFERLLGENINVEFDLSGEDIPVQVDPGRFQQVLLNLALNARDAMENGGTITITTGVRNSSEFEQSSLQEGEYALIEVRDTGIGMEQEVLDKAFEPFFT